LEQAREHPVDVEGLGVARHAFGETTKERHEVGVLARLHVEQLENRLAEASQRERAEAGAVPVERGRQQEPPLNQLGLQGDQPGLGRQRMPEPLPGGPAYGWSETGGVDQPPAA
jgi:hypothetical protein